MADEMPFAALARLAGSEVLLGDAIDAAMDRAADEAVQIIQSNMHFDRGYSTGQLEVSLLVSDGDERFSRIITADEPYASFVEYGTGDAGAASGVTPSADYQYGSRPGMAAEPYMGPSQPEVDRVVGWEVRRAVEEVFAGVTRA